MRKRPILTGTIVLPTEFMPAYPQMKRQPKAISGIIRSRMRTKVHRLGRLESLVESQSLLRAEGALLDGQLSEWNTPISDTFQEVSRLQNLMKVRASTPVPSALIEQVKAARREKVLNKTRERTRERQGFIFPITLRRQRKGPPAHVLAAMTPEQIRQDRVVRGSISEVGYIGQVKRRSGWKIREGLRLGSEGVEERERNRREGKVWSVEEGAWISPEDEKRLKGIVNELDAENARRQM